MSKVEEFYCMGCQDKHKKSNFYISYNSIHNGIMPICKNFIKNEVTKKDNSIDVERLKNLLMQMDAPFLADYWQKSVDDEKSTVGMYFKNLSLKQNRGLTWRDSTQNHNKPKLKSDDIVEYYEDNLDDFIATPEIKNRWRGSYTPSQLRDLEKFYNDMRMTHTIVTPQHIKSLIMMCKMQLKMDQFLEDNDMNSFSKLHDQYQKLLQSSGLRPIDKVGGDEATGMRSFSHIFEEVEKHGFIKPVSTTENQDIIDKTIQYIMNYTLKLLNQQVLTEPPIDTPKVDDIDG